MDFKDFRSDTVTRPTPEMRRAMFEAEVGDDVFSDDPTINRLEELAARTLGKEAAVLVPTGTMGNQISIMAQTRPGDELIAGDHCHIVANEGGGAARLSGVSCAPTPAGQVTAADVHRLVRAVNLHYPRTRLVCMENAVGNGQVQELEAMQEVHQAAKQHGLLVHLDGARIFNAAVALNVTAKDLADCADSVSFCLSKGLCAPVGSVICGSAEFIAEARRCRKVLGGGMRQAGILAAAGLIALTRMTTRLAEDHDNARLLAERLAELPHVELVGDDMRINMVFFRITLPNFDHAGLVAYLFSRGFKTLTPSSEGVYRLVTHHDVTRADVEEVAEAIGVYLKGSVKK